MLEALELIKNSTLCTEYEGKIYLVGGIVRDEVMGISSNEDADLVLEGDAIALVDYLYKKGVAAHPPVLYERFGTAMVTIQGRQIELVSARKETYDPESRKPFIEPATLLDDVLRRDFTINTLLKNLHSGEILDLTGKGRADIVAQIIRTPLEPNKTFSEDPLRMLRAIRFSARLGFNIEPETYTAIVENARRIRIVSQERIRDEFVKLLMTPRASNGLEMLRDTGLLERFAPELVDMKCVEQNQFHVYDCWTHTMRTLEALPESADIIVRLAALFHDVGKPETKSVDANGNIHFYGHQHVGASIAAKILRNLRFSNDQIEQVCDLIKLHLRPGSYTEDWSDSAIRRLMRDAGELWDSLLTLAKADIAASNTELINPDFESLETRAEAIRNELAIERIASPLNGNQIMNLLGIPPGPRVKEIKEYLLNEVIEGRLRPEDQCLATSLVVEKFGRK